MTGKRYIVALILALSWVSVPILAEDVDNDALRPRNEATFLQILKASKDPNRDVRSQVAWILGRVDRPEAISVLKGMLNDSVPDVRAAALRALCRQLPAGEVITPEMTVPVEDAGLRHAALAAAAHLRFKQREALIEAAMTSASPSERVLGLRALAFQSESRNRSLVLAALEDPNAVVRAAAVDALSAADANAISLILKSLAERTAGDSFVVRAAACRALARMKAVDGRKELHAAVSDEHCVVRREAIKALSALGDRSAVDVIRTRIADVDYTVRVAACVALGEMVEARSAPDLSDRLADHVIEVRAAAEEALAKFPPDVGYKVLLKYADYQERRETRVRAWRLLGLYGHPATKEMAFQRLGDSNLAVGAYALRVGRKLEDRRVIPHVINNILRTRRLREGGDEGPTALQAEEGFRVAILFGLKESIPFAILALKRALDPPMASVPLYMPDPNTVVWIARYLVAVKHEAAVPLLERVVTDPRAPLPESTRRSVLEVLRKMTGKEYVVVPDRVRVPIPDPTFIEVIEQ